MGVNIGQFEFPFCNSFRPKIIQDQLCYTVDPNEFIHKIDLKGDLSLSLFINYNEDRQLEDVDSSDDHTVIVDTIGNILNEIITNNKVICIQFQTQDQQV